MEKKTKIITHTDMDGLVSGFLVANIYNIEAKDIDFTEPWEIRKLNTLSNDTVICDLPKPNGFKGDHFDHHLSSNECNTECPRQIVIYEKSAARVIYNHFKDSFIGNNDILQLVEAVDKIDSASYKIEDLTNPSIYTKIAFLLDQYKNKELNSEFIRFIINGLIINKGVVTTSLTNFINYMYKAIVKEDVKYKEELLKNISYEDNILVIDEENIKSFHRDRYCKDKLDANNEIKPFTYWYSVKQNKEDDKINIYCGVNIFKKELCTFNIGQVFAKYGGGGHRTIGGCVIDKVDTSKVIEELKKNIKGE